MANATPALLPARMLNESVYCPRLFYLEWVDREWRASADTVEGRTAHRRVDRESPPLAADGERVEVSRSVYLSDEELGLTARIDLVEGDGEWVGPVDYKKGEMAGGADGVWPADRVQLGAQVLLLRAHGYRVRKATIYYVGSKRRVEFPADQALTAETLAAVAAAREIAAREVAPPPLEESPKCVGCSLAPICLPDEVGVLRGAEVPEPRRLMPARDDALPVYVQEQGATVGVRSGRLQIKRKGTTLAEVRLREVSDLSVFGGVQVSTAVIRELTSREIPILYFSRGGWFYSMVSGLLHKNVRLRQAQYSKAAQEGFVLDLARTIVRSKIRNQRTLLRRNLKGTKKGLLGQLAAAARRARQADSLEQLLGVEGAAARVYFGGLGKALKGECAEGGFDFSGRNRRPPRDPVNALLSFLYALLTKDLTITVSAVGLDPFLGFYHQPRYGRPALALDLMEEFRPLVVDSVVLRLVNSGEVKRGDFLSGRNQAALKEGARRRVIAAYGRRMDELVTHPVFGYRISYRRVLEVQTRLLGRFLLGEVESYPPFETR